MQEASSTWGQWCQSSQCSVTPGRMAWLWSKRECPMKRSLRTTISQAMVRFTTNPHHSLLFQGFQGCFLRWEIGFRLPLLCQVKGLFGGFFISSLVLDFLKNDVGFRRRVSWRIEGMARWNDTAQQFEAVSVWSNTAGTANYNINASFSIANNQFSGEILHNFYIFNRKIRLDLASMLQFSLNSAHAAVVPTTNQL